MGAIIQNNLKLDKEIGKLSSQLHNRIHNIRQITKFTTFTTRLKFLNGLVLGKLIYMIPLYSNIDLVNSNRLHKIITTTSRAAIGSYCYKKVWLIC